MKKLTSVIALTATACAFVLGSCSSKKNKNYAPAPMPPEVVVTK